MRKLNRSDGWEETAYLAVKKTTKQWKEFKWISWTAMKKYVCANLAYVPICMYACFSKNLYDFLPYNLKGDV